MANIQEPIVGGRWLVVGSSQVGSGWDNETWGWKEMKERRRGARDEGKNEK